MKKILIIGASILQLPAIVRAKEKGYYVAVADYNPEAIGVKYADEFFNASTIDIEAIVDIAKKFKPAGIMTLATDMPMRSVAAACAALGLPGISPDTAVKATDKGEMIKAFKENKVESPWFFVVNNQDEFNAVVEKLHFPCIIKPTDNAGSRGVILVNDKYELNSAYVYSKECSRHGAVIIEEYMRGSEVSVEIMVVEGKPFVLAVTDKITTGAPYFVEMGHSQPSRLNLVDVEKIKDLAIRAVKAIGIECGPAHVEIMLTAEGPKMIELGARMGGDCITTHLVPLSTGIDMVDATIDLLTGGQPNILPKIHKGSAIKFLSAAKGTITKIEGTEEAKRISGVAEVVFNKKIGETVGDIYSSTDRVGYVIAQGVLAIDAMIICDGATGKIKICTEIADK